MSMCFLRKAVFPGFCLNFRNAKAVFQSCQESLRVAHLGVTLKCCLVEDRTVCALLDPNSKTWGGRSHVFAQEL